jgi:maltose O-acetyltransferase
MTPHAAVGRYTGRLLRVPLRRRLKNAAVLFSDGVHFRFTCANAICRPMADFASGGIRTWLYRKAGFRIGTGSFIMGNLNLIGSPPSFYRNLVLGSHVVIGNHVTINLDAPVCLGDHVSIGPYVLVYTATHQIGPGSSRRIGGVVGKSVMIEDGCWIGVGAIILPGVSIGRGCVVAAGAVVTTSMPPNAYVEGNPAQVVRTLPWGDR